METEDRDAAEREARDAALVAIGSRIRQKRRQREMTQEKLAEEAKVSKSFLSEVEGGITAASGLVYLRIAQALDMEVQWLLTGMVPDETERRPTSVKMPPLLSEIAEEKGWSHKRTLDIAAALSGVVARRTREGRLWEPTREMILSIATAIPEESKR